MSKLINEVLICNTYFMNNDETKVQSVACRVRGEINGKTIKVSPHLFKGQLPAIGEAIYASYDESHLRESGNYRVLTNAKVAYSPSALEARQADDAALAAAEESHLNDQHANNITDVEVPF